MLTTLERTMPTCGERPRRSFSSALVVFGGRGILGDIRTGWMDFSPRCERAHALIQPGPPATNSGAYPVAFSKQII